MKITYKYLPPERISYFNDELLRISHPCDLNDPYECLSVPPSTQEAMKLCIESHQQYISTIQDELKNNEEKIDFLNQALNTELNKIKDDVHPNYKDHLVYNQNLRIDSTIFILCFSKAWNSSVMWAHYCKNHTGFCIGFDKNNPLFNESGKDNTSSLLPIKYSNKRIKIPIEKNKIFKFAMKILLTKSLEWIYEKEERIITSDLKTFKKIVKKDQEISLMKIPHSSISEVVVGLNIFKEDLDIIKEFSKINGIPLYHCKTSDNFFKMDRELVIV